MVKQAKDRSHERRSFRSAPRWIQAFLFPREARRRAVVRFLDELKAGVMPPKKPLG
jgi:hypothetical protein